MSSKKVTLICVRDCKCIEGKEYKFGNKYSYFKRNYQSIFNSIYTYSTNIIISIVEYDFLSDNFIEDTDIDNIDDIFGKKLANA